MYDSIFHVKAYFIFGGRNDNNLNKIGRLDAERRTWSLAGNMKQPRHSHAVVFDGEQLLIVGGSGEYNTENCVINGEEITCTEQHNWLSYYREYPELLLVDDDFGNDC